MSQNSAAKTPPKLSAAIAAATLLVVPFVATHEGVRTHPYMDSSSRHIETVCYGETNVPMQVYSNDQCSAMLRNHLLTVYAPALAKCIPATVPRSVIGALIDAAYNAGPGAVCASPMAARVRLNDYWGGCGMFVGWHTLPGTAAHKGLENRRWDEVKLCVTDLPTALECSGHGGDLC